MGSSLARLITAATFALAGSTALAANMAIDTANPANGLYDLYSATFDREPRSL